MLSYHLWWGQRFLLFLSLLSCLRTQAIVGIDPNQCLDPCLHSTEIILSPWQPWQKVSTFCPFPLNCVL